MFVFQMAGLYSEFVEVGNVGFFYRALSYHDIIANAINRSALLLTEVNSTFCKKNTSQ